MKYMLIQTREGDGEFPAQESGREKHLYDRGENISISSGPEAVLWIPGLRSRFYIRGMKLFPELGDGEHLYQNRKNVETGEIKVCPGDILLLKELKIEIWDRQISIEGPSESYRTSLFERNKMLYPEGFPLYKRSPRLIKRPSAEKIVVAFPQAEDRPDRKGLLVSILPSLGMMLAAVAVGLLTGRGIYLLMVAVTAGMTAIFSGIGYVSERMKLKEKNRRRHISYMNYLWCRQRKIAAAYEQELEIYAYQSPDMDALADMVREYDGRIYERIPSDRDFLTVSIGHYTGMTDFRIDRKEKEWDAKEDMFTERVSEICHRYSLIERPKVIDLKETHLGMVGEKEALHLQLGILAVQTAFFQSYHDVRMVVVYDREYEERFAWMRWLPHTRLLPMNVSGMVCSESVRDLVLGSIGQILKERAKCRKEGEKAAKYFPHYLFLIDEPSLVRNHEITEYLGMEGQALGFSIISTSHIRADLPEYIETVLLLENSAEGTLLMEGKEYVGQKVVFDRAQDVDFEWLARNLSVLEHEQEMNGRIPQSVTFFELYGIRHPEELKIRNRWKNGRPHRSLSVPLGLSSSKDVLSLNLHEMAHGPHGLIVGTTGSGKSELIQSYILSLAVNFHPYEAGILLIDYKGGGMADLFRELPHHLGTVTNLDGNGSMRALICVKAELSRRQRMFREFGVNHIHGYMKLFKEGTALEPLPHLFIVCDEFAELKKEQPEFMKELISAARIGRSLGVHLILATQKPAGIIDEQIWSNSRFKLCLKVQTESDSKEVLKTADAAAITLPGRTYLKVGNQETYELFQSAFSGAAYQRNGEKSAADDERIYLVNELGQGELIDQDMTGGAGEYRTCQTQLEAVVGHIIEVFREGGQEGTRKPWLPPLGKMMVSPMLEDMAVGDGMEERKPARSQEERDSLFAVIGKTDIPERQEQSELEYCFERDGNVLMTASSGFGKTVFLTTVLTSLAFSYDVDELNFYILDCGNHGCMPLKELPHTAEYISLDDGERYWKFKKLMTEELSERKRRFARYAASSPKAYRELSGKPLKNILIAIDQFDVIKEMGIEEEEFFTKLTRDGIGLGVYTVASAARINAVRLATLNNFKNKLAGYHFDENDTLLAVGRTPFKQSEIKGRVLVSGEKVHEAQIYTVAPCEDKAAYINSLKALIHKIRRSWNGKEAPHIPVLPQEFLSTMLGDYPNDGSGYLVGLDVEKVTGKGFDKAAGLFAIIGNTGTGKTNILQVLADQALLRGKVRIFDSKNMELYHYRQNTNVLYMEGQQDTDMFLEELSGELEERRHFLKKRLKERRGISPKKLTGEMPYYTILIDDLDDFTEFIRADLDRAVFLIKEGIALGIVCILTIHTAKSHGMNGMDRLVKQAANGLVLSSQGIVPVFPIPSMRELPKFGEGLLFKNGFYERVRLPRYVCQSNRPDSQKHKE